MAILVLTLHSQAAADRTIDALPLASDTRSELHKYLYGQTLLSALALMIAGLSRMPEQIGLAACFFLPPAALIVAQATLLDRRRRRARAALATSAIALSPCLILLVAWDLSRFLLWTVVAAFFALLANALDAAAATKTADSSGVRQNVVWAIALLALSFLATGPWVTAYVDVAFADFSFSPSCFRRTPAAQIAYRFLSVYNRRRWVDRFRSSDAGCALKTVGLASIPPCSFAMRPGGFIETNEIWLRPGAYVARVRTSGGPDCFGRGELAIRTPWRFAETKISRPFESSGPEPVPFVIDLDESVMTRTFIRVWATDGCFRLDEIDVSKQ